MGRITKDQVSSAYKVSKEVFKGNLDTKKGILILSEEHSLNKNSARDFINCFKCMMEGRIFHRAMSHTAMDYFIGNITKDFSNEYLKNVLSALEKHINYWEGHYKTKAISMRKILCDYRKNIPMLSTAESLQLQFEQEVSKSINLSSTERLKNIGRSNTPPKQLIVSSKVYVRNPHVVAERLSIAAGICEKCKAKAPFIRANDGTPYLEVHHKQQLSDDGLDIIENTIALCPNCHRELHFGKNE